MFDEEWGIRTNSAWPIERQRTFMQNLGELEGYEDAEDWNGYPKQALRDNGGYGLLKLYGGVEKVVKTLVPATRNMVWQRRRIGQFATEEGFRSWMREMLDDHGVRNPADCYTLSAQDFRNRSGGPMLLHEYGGFIDALQHYYGEEYRIRRYRFGTNGCWNDPHAVSDWIEDFQSENSDFSSPDDYYRIRKSHLPQALLKRAGNSPSRVVREILFPEYEFDVTLFDTVPDGTWDVLENRIRALHRVGIFFEFETAEDWLFLTQKGMRDAGLGGLAKWYSSDGRSIQDAPRELFPDFEYLPWLFESGVPPGFWEDIENIQTYMRWLGNELGYESMEDWYDIRVDHYTENYGGGLVSIERYANQVSLLVVDAFPEYDFDPVRFRQRGQLDESGLSRLQEEVTRAAEAFFVNHITGHEELPYSSEDRIILINHKHENHRFSKDGESNRRSRMESDIWVRNALPEIHMSIETHGDQHRRMPPQWSGEMTSEEATEMQQKRDDEKRIAFNVAGYIVIEIWEHEWIQAGRNPSHVHELIEHALQERRSGP